VQVVTQPRWDRDQLLKRDDPIGEVARIVAALRQDVATVATWGSIMELQNKLPAELAEGAEPIKLDTATLRTAIEEAEGLLLARLLSPEAL
jgi:hypothetical protein